MWICSLMSGKRLLIRSEDPSVENVDAVVKYTLFDMAGRILKEGEFDSDVTVNMSGLSRGIYLLRITKGKEVLKTEKIVLSD